MSTDTTDLKSRIDISRVIGQTVQLHKSGADLIGLCPFHQDSSPSFRVHPAEGYFKCHGCGAGGDVIEFVQKIRGITFREAVQQLTDQYGGSAPAPVAIPAPVHTSEWQQVFPVPADAPALPKVQKQKIGDKWHEYQITHFWPYRTALGDLMGYVIRYETAGGKETPTLTLHRNAAGELKWKRKGFPVPRPIIHHDRIAHAPDAQVIVVEGEKCAEVLQELLDQNGVQNIVTTTWPGGGKAVSKTDFSPLRGRRVILWPDFDLKKRPNTDELLPITEQPGMLTMNTLAGILKPIGCQMKLVAQVTDKPDGWDVADAILTDGWSLQQVLDFVRANITEPDPVACRSAATVPAPPAPPAEPSTTPEPAVLERAPFQCLGYNFGHYYYLPSGTKQVTAIRTQEHGPGMLMGLAPIAYWEREFPGSAGPAWKYASNTLMRTCERAGIYDVSKQRGRGAWYDRGRAVLHLGDRLLVDGKPTAIDGIDSKFVYEASTQLEYENCPALTRNEAHKLREVIDMLFWEKPIYATYLAGWIAIAPICGALSNRPHIWITGAAGTGKTHVLEHIIRPILGNFCLPVQSETTSAGVRQALGCDAIPVMLDEFEGDDLNGQERVQKMLELARQAFSDTAARIIKGGQSGRPSSYTIRSCFLMSSIAVNISKQADATRVMVLSLARPHDTETRTKEAHFAELCKATDRTITDAWASGFRARSIAMIPTIRKNAAIFATAVAEKTGNRRIGDQVGPLLAGAWSLSSDGIISADRAAEFVNAQDWSEQSATIEESDEYRCLNHIMQSVVRVSPNDLSIAELIAGYHESLLENAKDSSAEVREDYDATLRRAGIKYDHDEGLIYISSSHLSIRKFLHGTSWEKSWPRLLARIPDAIQSSHTRFMGARTRATGISYDSVFGG